MSGENEAKIYQEYDQFIGQVLSKQQLHPFLFCNESINRNTIHSDVLRKALQKNDNSRCVSVFESWFKFYKNCIFEFFQLFLGFLSFQEFGRKSRVKSLLKKDSKFLIQNFLIENKFLKEEEYRDQYLPGVHDCFDDSIEKPIIFSTLISNHFSLKRNNDLRDKLMRSSAEILLVFDLLKSQDFLKLIWFLISYPFFHLKLKGARSSKFSEDFNSDLDKTLGHASLKNYAHYLGSKRLGKMLDPDCRIIFWYENQSIHKLILLGLREGREGHFHVVGTQMYLFSPTMRHYLPTSQECEKGIVPDELFFNGGIYLEMLNDQVKKRSRLGPSIRYEYLWKGLKKSQEKRKFLLALPYFRESAEKIIQIFRDESDVILRLHPATPEFEDILNFPKHWEVSHGPIHEDFSRSDYFVTAASGTAIEALASGMTVLLVGGEYFNQNYLTPVGKDLAWKTIDIGDNLNHVISSLEKQKSEKKEEHDAARKFYLENFFTEPSKELIYQVVFGSKNER